MIYIGTSGFSYDDWKGEFYPGKMDKKNMLAYYAQHFNSVEINSTYYAIPSAASFAAMDRKTPQDFKFVVKAHRDMTHSHEPQQESFNAFYEAVQPLLDSDKLGCVLAQFPWGFKKTSENIHRLKDFGEKAGQVRIVVEFRNSTWASDETFDLLRELDVGYCCVDEPRLKGLMPGMAVSTSETGYIRFHGRNAHKWWKHEEAYERYDYLYSEAELQEWIPKAEQVVQATQDTYMFFNNHYKGKSAANAKMFGRMLGVPQAPAAVVRPKQMTLGEEF